MAKDLTGTTLGKYQIMERLGRGGMADVYRAYQPGMDRIVAIKIMHGHLASDESFVTRFKREAHSVGNLRHPNIVQVIDFDVQDDEYYMVMEYIQGDTLKAFLEGRGALPVPEALDITMKLADALAYAHAEGMIHRDIKPANVLFGKANTPILTDFGIARIMDQSGLTVSGVFVGTPSYVSPEAGRGEQVDERADIYSLGIVLYEMLTGAVPFDADTPYAVILKHINDPLPTPRQFNAALPEAVERVVLKALSKNKEDRFQNATEFKTALENAKEAAVSQMPTNAGNTLPSPAKTVAASAPAPQPDSAGRSNMIPLAVAGIVVIAVVIGIIAVLSNRPAASPPPTNAQVAGVATTTAAATTAAATNTTVVTNTAAATNTIAATTATIATQAATAVVTDKYAKLIDQVNTSLIQGSPEEALKQVEAALKDDAQSYDLLAMRARVYAESGDTLRDKAEPDAQAAIKIDPKRPEAYVALGEMYVFVKDSQTNDERVAQYKKAVANFTQAIDLGSQDYHAYWGRAQTNNALNGYTGSDNGVPDSVILGDIDKAVSLAGHDVRVYISRGQLYYDRRNFVEAQKSYEQALTVQPTAYDVFPYLAATYFSLDLNQKAYDLYAKAIDKDNLHDSKFLADGAYLARLAGKPDKANEWIKLALALEPDTPAANYDLALLAWDSKNYDEALKQMAIVLATSDASRYTFPFFNRYFNRLAHADQGRILADAGKLDEAVAAYDAALKEDPYWPALFVEQAKVYIKLGKLDTARQNLRTALDQAISDKNDNVQKESMALLDQLGAGTATEVAS